MPDVLIKIELSKNVVPEAILKLYTSETKKSIQFLFWSDGEK